MDRQRDRGTYLGEAGAEACEDLPHVASLLHANDAQVVLLIHPHQEGLVVIMPEGEGGRSGQNHRVQTGCREAGILTRCHGRRANRGPSRTPAAEETRAYRTGSGHR